MNALESQPRELENDTHLTVLKDWRQISYAAHGPADGRAIFVFHDLPGSRMQQHPDRRIPFEYGVRLIHPDRPGFGMSTPKLQRSFVDWACDIYELAHTLGIHSFAIAAIGGSAPYALACAAMLPERVSKVAIASTYVPPDLLQGLGSWRLRAKLMLSRRAPASLRALLKKDSFRATHDCYHYLHRWERQLALCDSSLLDSVPGLRAQYEQDAREAFRQSTRGVRAELRLLAYPWQIDFSQIRSELRFWHGREDRVVHINSATRLVEALPGAQLQAVEGAGHLVWYTQWRSILDFLCE
ncbi:MAG TPA: alpha/beta hydrolase [Burkholderiales bacterium]|nr:alpha/beta hydrolase [Burkholderiales bacterium]